MNNQFHIYAKFYDLLYKDKKYNAEAAYIHELIRKHTNNAPAHTSLLDLACGTGKHLFELADIGYSQLSGSDISQDMINVAREKAGILGRNISFYNYSFQDADRINQDFDVVISMFSAVNYITSFSDQLKTFRNIHKLLKDDGIVMFDYWNGNAVMRDYSPVKVLRKKSGETEIMRISNTSINTITQDVEVKFTCLYFENDTLLNEFEEVHKLHYYHFSEMFNLLEVAGFDVMHVSPFLEPDNAIRAHDWNVSIVAKKRNH